MLEIREAITDEDLGQMVAIIGRVSPDNPMSVEEARWQEAQYPGGKRFVAWLDGVAVGCGGAGRVYMYAEDFPALWGNISVLPEFRGRGVGSALLEAIGGVARANGKPELYGRTTGDRPEAIRFLERRGFREVERMKVVRLDLAGHEPPAIDPPAGITITSLEARPDLAGHLYEVAVEALPDIPGDGRMDPGTPEEFLVRDVDRSPMPKGGYAVAVDDESGTVVGYSNLMLVANNPRLAWHGMTAVRRAWRGRGIAGSLKRATISWAVANGLDAIETANDVDNAPMRAVNRRLGYRPLPDEVYFQGPASHAGVPA
ncbi:MAG TPA: GNAT family N-acetyltransferase [Candidatus Limnocylindrales bacterium]|nr:GNAT family N-acetyltransferase [Candidatus Limnocylindrales bacterium]